MAQKIAVVNNKGGALKSTTVVNLAGTIHSRNPQLKICLVDNDGQGNVGRSFGHSPKEYSNTMYDVFMGSTNPEDATANVYNNIDIIPANTDMNFFEFDKMKDYEDEITNATFQLMRRLSKSSIDLDSITYDQWKSMLPKDISITKNYFNLLENKFDQLDKEYDIILFDTPPEIKAVTSSVLSIADHVIVPYEPEIYSVDGIVNILERIEYIRKEYNNDLKIAGLLAVKVKANTKVHTDTMNKVMMYANKINVPFFSTVIPNTIKFATSTASRGLPATLGRKVKSSEKLIYSYYSLLDEMIAKGSISLGGDS